MIKKISEYDNFLNKIKFNYSDAIEMISNIPYEEGNIESKLISVEVDNSLPKFVYPFYEYIKFKQKIPNIQEFWNFYYKLRPENKKYFQKTNVYIEDSLALEALKYRVSKTYPSLVREFLCILLAKESLSYYEVIYNTDLDINCGIDFLIKADKYYGIKLYINTNESLYYAEKKINRHNEYIFPDVEYINLPFNIYSKDKLIIGNFFLYSNNEIDNLMEIINTH